MHFTPEKVVHQDLSLKKVERENLPLPLPFGATVKYSNLQAVSALVCQLVQNNQGVWETAVSSSQWGAVYRSSVSIAGLSAVGQQPPKILSDSKTWQLMSAPTKNSITGSELLSFVTSVLNETTAYNFYVLNNLIVFQALLAMEKIDGQWRYVLNDQAERAIPPEVFDFLPGDEAKALGLQELLGVYPAVARYKGGLKTIIVGIPPGDGTLKTAQGSLSKLRQVQGGDNSCMALLSQMRDYSGLTDDFGRRVQFMSQLF